MLKILQTLNLSDTIINLGTVPVNDVGSLYAQVDTLLLPTLLESFSATYADSLCSLKNQYSPQIGILQGMYVTDCADHSTRCLPLQYIML